MTRQFILTEDGSHTIFVPEMGEHYHSVHGAIQESRHIFIGHGYFAIKADTVSILEVGFGTGLNALLTVICSIADLRKVHYEAWEAFPLTPEESALLNYPAILGSGNDLFRELHHSPWGIRVSLTPTFELMKIQEDICNFRSERKYDLVYFDAFGPDFQPELWTTGVFQKIGACMDTNSRLVTYSAKGQIRRNLREAGFLVQKAPGPPGKREITVALKL